MRSSSDGPATPDNPLRSARRRPWGPLLTLRYEACVSGLRVSSASDPKTSEDGHPLRSFLALASVYMPSCLRAPSATGPKVVSPTVAPQSLGPIFGRGAASTRGRHRRPEALPFGLGAAMVSGEAQSVLTCKMLYFRRGSKEFRIKPLVRTQIIGLKNLLAGVFPLAYRFEKTKLPLGLLISDA